MNKGGQTVRAFLREPLPWWGYIMVMGGGLVLTFSMEGVSLEHAASSLIGSGIGALLFSGVQRWARGGA